MPPAVSHYFWLLTLGAVLVTVAVWHRRAAALVALGRITEVEHRRFTWGAALTLGGFCALVQAIAWITGESRPECLGAFPPTTAASIATSVLTVIAWGALLWWVWGGRGADQLARLGPALMPSVVAKPSYSPGQIRRFIAVVVIVGLVGGAVASRVVPPPADCRQATTSQSRSTLHAG